MHATGISRNSKHEKYKKRLPERLYDKDDQWTFSSKEKPKQTAQVYKLTKTTQK